MTSIKSYSCIIVEDEVHHQELLSFYLKKLGNIRLLGMYADTVNASIQIEKKKPDLIFLDINISGLEGPEFIELLEYQPKIIMISAHSEEFMNNHYQIPYLAYVQKPISLDKLQDAIALLE
ncbi:LytR/AlgR family response regulator transcription factor [Marinoscillum sp.]|uniref:LytR/AlgR family response regulator transcription factor n=1 Tax=Marinoscillum sp. TaxID=2024838 RepID=UPI003BAA801C